MSNEVDVTKAILAGVGAAVALPSTNATSTDKSIIAYEVQKTVMPVVEHLTNNEPWYRSRVTWGAIASIALPLLGIAGVTSDVISSEEFVSLGLAVGSAAGGLFTLYGRWKARKPLGE